MKQVEEFVVALYTPVNVARRLVPPEEINGRRLSLITF